MRLRARSDRVRDLAAHEIGRGRAHQRAERGLGFGRIAEPVASGELDQAVDEAVVDRLVDVDPLDRAARLAAVEERAVGQVLDRVGEVGIGADVGRVLAAELEADAEEAAGGRLLHRMAAGRPSR